MAMMKLTVKFDLQAYAPNSGQCTLNIAKLQSATKSDTNQRLCQSGLGNCNASYVNHSGYHTQQCQEPLHLAKTCS
jgi:hypothetical protein